MIALDPDADIRYEPACIDHRRSICYVTVKGKYMFNEGTRFPRLYDFKKQIEVTHLISWNNVSKDMIECAAEESGVPMSKLEIVDNEYGEGLWVWIRDVVKAARFTLALTEGIDAKDENSRNQSNAVQPVG